MRKVLLLAMGICLVIGGTSIAFHDQGVAHCNGCHTMHNSSHFATAYQTLPTGEVDSLGNLLLDTLGNPLVDDYVIGGDAADLSTSSTGYPKLLKDATASDVCLGCHAKYGQMLGTPSSPTKITPAGNFIFLLADNLNESHYSSTVIPGDAAGHNLNAPGFGLGPDAAKTTAPGGTFLSTDMGCSSCHDPHGSATYRLLYGAGRVINSNLAGGSFTFANAAPLAEGISRRNPETPTAHTAYKSGMSSWCANCHGDYHATGDYIHPTNQVMNGTVANYNKYRGTGETYDLSATAADVSYLAEVPFENPSMNFASEDWTASTKGPDASSRVMCLSCHRAHASSGPNSGRWDFNVTLLHEDGYRDTPALTNPYAATSGDNQRSLCNKCHVKDEFDHVE